jgi:copper homeostasis protein (lipoprotein)
MNKKLLALLAILLLITAGFIVWPRIAGHARALATYEGILPGADCAGLKTELTLYQDGSYFLRETYLATRDGDKTFTSTGKWQKRLSKGRAVIRLNYDKPQDVYNFLQKDADHIVVIDKEMRDIDCPMNLMLSRKK